MKPHLHVFLSALIVAALYPMFAEATANRISPPSLAGRVVEADTESPLLDVHVTLMESGLTTVTGADGGFTFQGISPDNYNLRISHLGFRTIEVPVRIREGLSTHVAYRLVPDTLLSTPVVLTAGRKTVPGTFLIDETAISRSTWQDVGEALRGVPGIQINEEGVKGGRKTASIRGCRPDHVIVMLDGVPLNDGAGEAIDLASIPLEGVNSIEIKPGPDPEGGPGGLGGVICINSFAGLISSQESVQVDAGIESCSGRNASLMLEGKHHNIEGRLFSRYLYSRADFQYIDERGEERKRINNSIQRGNLALYIQSPITGNWSLRNSLSFSTSHKGSPSPLHQMVTPEAYHRDSDLRVQGTAYRPFGPGLLTTGWHYNHRWRRYENPRYQTDPETGEVNLYAPVDIIDQDDRAGLSLSVKGTPVPSGSEGLTGGMKTGADFEKYQSYDGISGIKRVDGEVFRSGWYALGFAEAVKRAGQLRTGFRGSTRFDVIRDSNNQPSSPFRDKSVSQFTAAGRLTLQPAGRTAWRWNLHAGGGSSFAPPSFLHSFLVENVFALGNPDLKPEHAIETSIGGGLSHSTGTGTVETNVAAFHRITRDMIIWRRNFRGQYQPVNLGKAIAGGIELSVYTTWFSGTFSLGGTVTFQQVENHDPDSPLYGNKIPFQPEYYGASRCALHLDKYDLACDLRFSGRRFTSETNLDPYSTAGHGLEPFQVIDLSFKRELSASGWSLKIKLVLENVLNAEYELLDRMPMPGQIWSIGCEIGR